MKAEMPRPNPLETFYGVLAAEFVHEVQRHTMVQKFRSERLLRAAQV
jgi:hypothetical protein